MSNPWWPLFALQVRTPRVELRLPTDDDLPELVELAAAGIHPPDQMPFTIPWTRERPPEFQRSALRYHWRTRAETTAERWSLPFSVYEDGVLVGCQDLRGEAYAVRRTVTTGSWLGQSHQGRGLGREMRAAVLHLAFAHLGAQRAETEAFADNPASLAVTRALGYEPNGETMLERLGQPARSLRFALDRPGWEARRREDIVVTGLEPCLPLLGVDRAPALPSTADD